MTNRIWSVLVGVSLVMLVLVVPVRAQQTSNEDLRNEIKALTDSVKQMQKDLQEIKGLLQSRVPVAPPQNVVIDIGNSRFQGQPTAKVTLVEFSDYQCPFCGRYVRETGGQIDKEYVATGKVRHVFLNMPLEGIHKYAFKAAEAANCAGEQDKYWEMHQRLFENQSQLESLAPYAEAVGLDITKFQECLNSGRQAAAIRNEIAEAQKAGVTGTPTFFLALTDPNSPKVRTVRRLTGAQSYTAFKAEIDKLLGAEAPASANEKSELKPSPSPTEQIAEQSRRKDRPQQSRVRAHVSNKQRSCGNLVCN